MYKKNKLVILVLVMVILLQNTIPSFVKASSKNDAEQISSESVNSELISNSPDNLTEYKTNRFIIKYKDQEGSKHLKNSLNNVNSSKKLDIKNEKNIEVLILNEKVEADDFIKSVKEQKNKGSSGFDFKVDIEYIQPDYELAGASVDEYFNQQWGVLNTGSDETHQAVSAEPTPSAIPLNMGDPLYIINEIAETTETTGIELPLIDYRIDANVPDAWLQSKGEGTIIAVIDTGIDISQEDLTDNIWCNREEIPDNNIDDDNNGYIDDIRGWNFVDGTNAVHNENDINNEWHGTHIAGIIAAQEDNEIGIAGVAPDAKIMPLRVFQNGSAYTSDIISAIDYAEKMGTKIINCSWGSTDNNPILEEAISQSDMLFVCAAGNSHINIDQTPVYPASYDFDNVISVASIGKDGILSGFSNYGEESVDVAAPGENIISTYPDNEYLESSGTSMATAFVSGEAALLLGLNGDYDAADIKGKIVTTSDHLSSLEGKIRNGNKINCNNAVNDVTPEEIIEIDAIDHNNYSSDGDFSQNGYSLYAGGTWTQRAKLIVPVNKTVLITYPECVSLNGRIYATGGWDQVTQFMSQSNYMYNPTTNSWSTEAGMIALRARHVVAVVNGKIYAIGGFNQNGVEFFNPATYKWTLLTSNSSLIPTPVLDASVAVVGNIIYVIGGDDARNYHTNIVQAFDTTTNTWTVKRSMTNKRYMAPAAVLNGKIYVTGGSSNTMEIYDPVTDSWTLKAGLSTYGAMVALEGNLYCFDPRAVNLYSPLSDSWTQCSTPPDEYNGIYSANLINNEIFITGGKYGSAVYVQSYKPNDGNDIANAINLQEETETLNQIDYIGDQDYYSFTAGYTNSYDIYTSRSFDTYGYLYNSSGTLLAENDDNSGDINFHISANLTAGSKYYIRIRHKNDSSTGTYGLRITKTLAVPTNIAYSTNANLITLSWTQTPFATKYDIEVDGTIISCNTSTNYSHLNPALDVVHAYRVRAKSDFYTGSWSKYILVAPQGSTWQLKTNMSLDRYYLGVAYLNDNIYAIGGYGTAGAVNTVEEYDIDTNIWRARTGMSVARFGLGVVALNGKIYAIGGYNTSGDLNIVEEYDPEANTWTKKANMPTARHYFGIAVLNGKIYVIGGANGNTTLKSVEVYDPLCNTWSTKSSMNTTRCELSATTLNNKIYAIGGYNQAVLNTVEEYDPSSNSWIPKTGLNTNRNGLDTVTINGEIYAIGGYNQAGIVTNSLEAYSPVTNSWTNKESKLIKSYLFDAILANGKLYVIGGYSNIYGILSTVEALSVDNETYEYIYDSNNRLKEIRKSGNTIYYFLYDKNGNLISIQAVS